VTPLLGQEGKKDVPYRFSGGMSLIRWLRVAISSRLYDNDRRLSDGGRLAIESPERHSVAGRIGRGAKPPPQLGQTLSSTLSTQSAQNVHS